MISKIELQNFKCFSKCDIPLKDLTVLAGSNGCGKSTVIQSLLLLRQSYDQFKDFSKVVITGEYICLGYNTEIINEFADEDYVRIGIVENNDNRLMVEIPSGGKETAPHSINVQNECELTCALFSNAFEYLCAERLGPRDAYDAQLIKSNLGIHGEKTFRYLATNGIKPIDAKLCKDNTHNSLYFQANIWLAEIFPGFRFSVSELMEISSVSVKFQEVSRDNASNEHRPINVGFGITYALPILIALLKSKENDLIIIENPECHLHPKAQRILGELICKVANLNRQIILETHSDHVLNGIRIAAKQKKINHEKVQILFFSREDIGMNYNTNVYAPNLLEDGGIDYWPEGFFDEWDNAMVTLF